ncbi:MAG: BolA family transcriptional regulator [Vampirovibrionales bacterium]|nr:BolA family transcriptional regulator [Vampirovibrionales bacterium]
MDLTALQRKLIDALDASRVEIIDHTPEHAGHPASAGRAHLGVTIVSSRFEGVGALDRHRLTHRALADEMAHAIHALSLTTYSPTEWDAAGAGGSGVSS